MPDHNRKVLPDVIIARLNTLYTFTYEPERNVIVTTLSTCKRVTEHDADKPFVVISRLLGKKLTFNLMDIEIWKELQSNKSTSKYSLFDVHNTVNKLKIMYQKPTAKSVSDMLKSQFSGIKRI